MQAVLGKWLSIESRTHSSIQFDMSTSSWQLFTAALSIGRDFSRARKYPLPSFDELVISWASATVYLTHCQTISFHSLTYIFSESNLRLLPLSSSMYHLRKSTID